MATAVKISDKLLKDAKRNSKVENRSVAGQIEYWAKIGKLATENKDLTFDLIYEILLGLAEEEAGLTSQYLFND